MNRTLIKKAIDDYEEKVMYLQMELDEMEAGDPGSINSNRYKLFSKRLKAVNEKIKLEQKLLEPSTNKKAKTSEKEAEYEEIQNEDYFN